MYMYKEKGVMGTATSRREREPQCQNHVCTKNRSRRVSRERGREEKKNKKIQKAKNFR